jgi:SNF2 family DNA or RNA helicase
VSKDRKAYAYFMEMGTGKSKVVIDNAGYLFLNKRIGGHVIVAPKGVYLNWVENELPIHMSEAVPMQVAYWSSYARKEEREALKKLHQPGNMLRTLVVNVEAMNSERAVDEVVDFMKKYSCMLTVDESTAIKNPQAKRTKILINVGKFAEYRRICSGSPMPNGPLDLYSQTEFLQKNLLGYTNYFAFRNRFAIMQDQRFGQQSFKRVVGYRDLDALKALMHKFSFIVKKQDCLDLPPKVYQTIDITMGPRQMAAYNAMLNDAYIQLDKGTQVTAPMVMTQLVRLHQIVCGFMKPDFMEEVPFGEPNERLATLLDLLDQAPGKVIIWASYRYNVRQIVAAISEKYGKESVVDFYGATSDDDRKYAKQAFQDSSSPVKYIVSNPASGRFGNTWTQGTTTIYYSNDYNLESREQSEDRNHRIGQAGAVHTPGQDPSVLYIDLQVRGTVDERIVKVLKAKKKLTDEIVQSNWKWLLGSAAT